MVGALVSQHQANVTAEGTFSYVGDLTAERIARYADAGSDLVSQTAGDIVDHPGGITLDEAARIMYLQLDREPQVHGAYVGLPDGRFVRVSRSGQGYVSRRVALTPERRTTESFYDTTFKLISSNEFEFDYDPRDRAWYIAGQGALDPVWAEPFLRFDTDDVVVSAAVAARSTNALIAVVGADLNLEQMATVLDSLPLGEGAEGFIMSPDRAVIAAPPKYAAQLQATANQTGAVPLVTDIGLVSDAAAVRFSDGDVFRLVGGMHHT